MKFLKKFKTESDYNSYRNGSNFITPNVSYVVELAHLPADDPRKSVMFSPAQPEISKAGDIAYWNGSKVKTVSLEKWNNSLGTPIGVVVVPKGFASDGKIRIIGLKPAKTTGVKWGNTSIDSQLTNYKKVPITDNIGFTSTSLNSSGYLPSDRFNNYQSYVDASSKYNNTNNMVPSPYLGNNPNTEYSKELNGNNVLSDFNGLSNTEYLVGLGSDYVAANAAWNYNDGASNLQWYLPAAGELSYLMPRFIKINSSISAVGGNVVSDTYYGYWTSSEYNSGYAYKLTTSDGKIDYYSDKDRGNCFVRSFAMID